MNVFAKTILNTAEAFCGDIWDDYIHDHLFDEENMQYIIHENDTFTDFNISEESVRFLTEHGVPRKAPPLISFMEKDWVKRLSDNIDDDNDFPPENFINYIIIGRTGEGLPVCIKEGTDAIYYVDHVFTGEIQFMNSSLNQMYTFFQIYSEFNKRILASGGRDAVIDRIADPDSLSWVKNQMSETDPQALAEGSFWMSEIEKYDKN